MIRTNTVKLQSMKAFAYRQKLKAGDIAVVIVKAGYSQPGLATISRKTGEPAVAQNINEKEFPIEAFREAMELTQGMPFRKQGSIKVTEDMFIEKVEEEEATEDDFVEIDEAALNTITDHFTDKKGYVSYGLINKELIRFAKSSSIVRDMIAEGKSVKEIREYIILNKFRSIAGNDNLKDAQVFEIADMIDGLESKGAFRELNEELRKLLAKNKRA